jgi:hypothetical protein
MKRRPVLLLGLWLALALGGADAARGSQTVWSGLVIANNVAHPEETPMELRRVEETLKELFGYNQFTVIGQSKNSLVTGAEDWAATSKYFSLHVDSKEGNDKTGYRLDLKLYQEKSLLLETEAKLSKASPLIIKGPLVGDGQLILLLVVQ